MFCPKCRAEFREGFTHCVKCNANLVDELPGDGIVDADEIFIVPVCIRSVSSHIEAEMIMELLHQNGIPCYREYNEAGEYLRLYMGYSIYGEDIFVDWDDYDVATELLDDWDMNKGTGDDESDDCVDNTSFYKICRTASRIFALYFAALLIFSKIYGVVNALQYLLYN